MKYARLKKNADFRKLFDGGKRVFSPCLTVIYSPAHTLTMGIAVSKKHGGAVKRNRIKRLVRAAFFNTCGILEKNFSIVIIPKTAEEYSEKNFEKSMLSCFKKVNAACAQN